jgi:hypothetical protein
VREHERRDWVRAPRRSAKLTEHRRSVAVRVSATVAAVALALTGCAGWQAGDERRTSGGPLVSSDRGLLSGVAKRATVPGRSYFFGGLLLCTTGGTVVLEGVEAGETSGDVRLEDAGARPLLVTESTEGTGEGPLPPAYKPASGTTVEGACDDEADARTELALQLSRGSAATAGVRTFLLDYRVGEQRYRHEIFFSVILCGTQDGAAASFTTQRCGDG